MTTQTKSTSGLTYKNRVVTLRGAMLKKVLSASKRLGVTPEALCKRAIALELIRS